MNLTDTPRKPVALIRGRWACIVYPHPDKKNSSTYCARTGEYIINVTLHNDQVGTFDPEAFWENR